MKLKSIFLLVALMLTALTQAQPPELKKVTISGTIVDADSGQPLEYATVVLQSVRNPEMITGGITDMDGKFNVEADAGMYNVKIEFISYKSYELKQQAFRESKNLGTIKLAVDVAQLEAVEVVGERTTVEVRLDKKIYNVGKDLTTSGATVSDALNNVPSVTVDVEGTISLRGNDNVRILINGKPSALAGYGSTDALRQLPADAIEKVEVITSPSARYDAEGTAGILNIVLKKEKTLGINGSANVTLGYPNNSQITSNINLRTDKFNLFNTLGYFYREPPGRAFFDNTYASGDFSRITEDRDMTRLDKGFNINLGMEYFLTEKSSLTGSFFTRITDESDITENRTERYIGTTTDSRTTRVEDQSEDDTNYQFSLNYINKFNDKGHQLTVDMQYSYGDEDVFTLINENNTFPNNDLLARENIYEREKQNNYLAQADYVLPMGESQFEAGYRGTFDRTETDYQLDTLNQGTGQYETNQNLTNIFTYKQNVNAFYTQYGTKLGKVSFLLGLRLENTQLIGEVESLLSDTALEEELGVAFDTNFNKNYLGLFPTVNLTYELTDSENISIGYNRRINRPRGWFINPFPSRSSRTNVFQGNPDLDPAYANAFDIGYLKRWQKVTLTSSIYYQKEENAFERIQETTGETTSDGIDIIRSIPINLSTNERYGAEASLTYNPTRKIRLNGSFNFFKFVSEGTFNNVDYGAENTSWFARFSSKVTLPAKIDWQTNAFYRGASQNAQTKSDGIFSLDVAFSKDIMKDKGTIAFNISDVLNSRKRQSLTQTDFFTSDSEFQWRKRQFNISFIYRFNQPKERGNRRGDRNREGGGDDDYEFQGSGS